jgi:hypothetical protein
MSWWEFQPFSDDEKQLLAERSIMFSFNNFFCHFPRGQYYELNYKKRVSKNEENDIDTYKFPKLVKNRDERVPVSYKQFYEELHQSIVDAGMTMDEMNTILDPWFSRRATISHEEREKVFDALEKVYIIMRNKGYARNVLWS